MPFIHFGGIRAKNEKDEKTCSYIQFFFFTCTVLCSPSVSILGSCDLWHIASLCASCMHMLGPQGEFHCRTVYITVYERHFQMWIVSTRATRRKKPRTDFCM